MAPAAMAPAAVQPAPRGPDLEALLANAVSHVGAQDTARKTFQRAEARPKFVPTQVRGGKGVCRACPKRAAGLGEAWSWLGGGMKALLFF